MPLTHVLVHIGIDFGGAARALTPNNRESPMHLSVFTTFCLPVFGFAHPIFLASLGQCLYSAFFIHLSIII